MLRERIRPTLFGIGLAVVTVALVGGGLAAPATAATSPATAVAKILADTNALRASKGLAPLVENPAIDQVAQAWAAQMGAAGTMSHNPSYATQMPSGWTQAAENVATGYAYDRVVPDGWTPSAGHLANMLGDYTDIGIGYWESSTGVTYFVQDFGKYASSTPSPTPSASATPSPTPSPSGTASSASMPNLPTIPWSGGPAYYAQFPVAKAGGWTDPSFFPIGVWYGKPGHAATLASLGINTYVNAEHDGSPISMVTNQGISVIAGDEWTPAEVKGNNKVVGWQVSDECEMAMGPCATGGEAGALATQKSLVAPFRAYNDGRFLQANFSNGALGTWWAPNTMSQHVGLMDVTSVDKYAYTNPEADYVISQAPTWPKGKDPNSSAAYGWLQDRMETYSSKPNWVIIETAKPYLDDPSARTIQPNQIEGAVWNAIIHGATGITYFQHNNNGCGNYSIVECGATLQNKIKAIDTQVKSLAPVINTQSYVWNFGSGLDTSLKVVGGYAYIFAMTDGSTGSKTFTLPAGLAGSVQVVDENRTITANGGSFSDSFPAEYTHHIYKVALIGAPPVTGNQAPPSGGSTTAPPSDGGTTPATGSPAPSATPYVISPWFLSAWLAQGGSSGRLGDPTAGAACMPATCFQQFEDGVITGSPTGPVTLYGAYRDAWFAAGGPSGSLGLPLKNEVCNGSDCWQAFQGGLIDWTPGRDAVVIPAWFAAPWQSQGGGRGRLGVPTAAMTCVPETCYQAFAGGVLSGAPSGVMAVFGAYRDLWFAVGGPGGSLGLPTGSESCNGRDCSMNFQGGVVDWTAGTGAVIVTSWFLAPWRMQGAGMGRLGPPTAAMACVPQTCYQHFTGGVLSGSPSGRILPIYGAYRTAWLASGGPAGSLGLPLRAESCNGAWCSVGFEHGVVTWSPSAGAFAIAGSLYSLWAASGGGSGRYGLPVAAAVVDSDGVISQRFQYDTLTATP